jgi:diaminopimelate decarboxylase
MDALSPSVLARIADRVGTPFYLYDAAALEAKLASLGKLTAGLDVRFRYAMKANSARKILEVCRANGAWIDAVSGNEVLRALAAGFAAGAHPPEVVLTTDVFRDNALDVVLAHGIRPTVGSPGMIRELARAKYRGPIAVRVNPGFGHGHVAACDTGGPASKHGIWPDALPRVLAEATAAGMSIVGLQAHLGTGPEIREFDANMSRLASFFAELLPAFPHVVEVSFGGGIPHAYRPEQAAYDLDRYRPVLERALERLAIPGRPRVALEIEPGRYVVAGAGFLVSRVTDVKDTKSNEKGAGHRFVMVDAGFNDLPRPALYGAYQHISVVGAGTGRAPEPLVVAGPLCESGDVFTRDQKAFLAPRALPRPDAGDLLVFHDAGAYGMSMSSNYVSLGRAPQVYWEGGKATLLSRRETAEDLLRLECEVPIG